MRLTAYNILDGGTGRADPLAEVLLAQRPDVVVLSEATDPEVVARLAKRLGMTAVTGEGRAVTAGSGYNRDAIAILTRFEVACSANHALLSPGAPQGLLRADLLVPGGGCVPVVGLHLHARAGRSDEQARLKEMGVVLDLTRGLRASGVKHVLAGDFNSNSPLQRIDLSKVKEATRKSAIEQGGEIPRDVIALIEQQGYVDTLAATDRTLAAHAGTFTTQHPGQRVDFIFAYQMQVHSASVETHRLAKYASDHFPVSAELK